MNDLEPTNADARRKNGHATQERQGAHIGTAKLIKEACWNAPRSRSELAIGLGLPESVIKSSVDRMLGLNGGGLIATGKRGTKHKRTEQHYATFGGPAAKSLEQAAPFAVAGAREQPEDRPLKRDPFAHMKLCMATRR